MRDFIGIYRLLFFPEIYVTLLYKKWNGHSETIPEITQSKLQERINTILVFSLLKENDLKLFLKNDQIKYFFI